MMGDATRKTAWWSATFDHCPPTCTCTGRGSRKPLPADGRCDRGDPRISQMAVEWRSRVTDAGDPIVNTCMVKKARQDMGGHHDPKTTEVDTAYDGSATW